jgi:hypothetical protein
MASGAQYVILQSRIRRRKVKICRLGSGKWFSISIVAKFGVAGKRRGMVVHLHKRV